MPMGQLMRRMGLEKGETTDHLSLSMPPPTSDLCAQNFLSREVLFMERVQLTFQDALQESLSHQI